MERKFSREIILIKDGKTRAAFGGIIGGSSMMEGRSFGFAKHTAEELRRIEKKTVNSIVKVYLKG